MEFIKKASYGERVYSIPEIVTFGRKQVELRQESDETFLTGITSPGAQREQMENDITSFMSRMAESMPDTFKAMVGDMPDAATISSSSDSNLKHVKKSTPKKLEKERQKHLKELSLIDVYDESDDWGDEQEQQLKHLIKNWPSISSALRTAVFAYYKKHYTDFFEHEHGHAPKSGRILMPEPTEETIIDELFTIGTINIEKGSDCIGLSGGCTWESEHGFGALIEGTQVIEVGSADISFGIPSENVAFSKGESLENQN